MNKKVAKKTLTDFRESLQLTNERINGIYKSAPSLRPVRKTKPSTKVRRVSEVDCGNNNYCACKETIITDTARPRWKKVIMDSHKSCPSWSNAAEMQRYEKALSKNKKSNLLGRVETEYKKKAKERVREENSAVKRKIKKERELLKVERAKERARQKTIKKAQNLEARIKKLQAQEQNLFNQQADLRRNATSQIRVSM